MTVAVGVDVTVAVDFIGLLFFLGISLCYKNLIFCLGFSYLSCLPWIFQFFLVFLFLSTFFLVFPGFFSLLVLLFTYLERFSGLLYTIFLVTH